MGFLQRYCKQRDRVPGWPPCGDGVRRCCLRRPAGASLVIPVLGSDSCVDIFISKLVLSYSAHDLDVRLRCLLSRPPATGVATPSPFDFFRCACTSFLEHGLALFLEDATGNK